MSFDRFIDDIVRAFGRIGYPSRQIQRNYQFSDFLLAGSSQLQTVDVGVFGQEPLNYRSACFAIQILRQNVSSQVVAETLRALGAPQIFVVLNGRTERWVNTAAKVELKESVQTDNLPKLIEQKKTSWNPETLIRMKSGFEKPQAQQIDFIDIGLLPALDHEASKKIDVLLRDVLSLAEHAQKKSHQSITPDLFSTVFMFLTAKLLKDWGITTRRPIDFTKPRETLAAASEYYKRNVDPRDSKYSDEILFSISSRIAEAFSFRNLSVDTLTYIYENTFVSSESRKKLGIHSTPSQVADYVLSQLPIEEIPKERWNVYDPMCGHSIFLIAAMRRMRDLLPKDWDGKRRHRFFAEHLLGTEIDSFSVEVAFLCLTLADFPEANGWRIHQKDIFEGKSLERNCSRTTILVGNPPFEKLENVKPETPKPAELLRRALPKLPTGSFIGLILPRSFLDGLDYRKERDILLRNFEILSITTLPDKVFLYSDFETAIVVARKITVAPTRKTVYSEVRDQDRSRFLSHRGVTWTDTVDASYFQEKTDGLLTVPPLREIWECLSNHPKLREIADIRIGVQYEPRKIENRRDEVIRSERFANSSPAIFEVTDGFQQFTAQDTVYISTDKSLHRRRALGAWKLPWHEPKVVIPAGRMSRGPWRYAAAIDRSGRIASRDFYSIWTKNDQIDVETISAILNSPLAQAFVYSNSSQRGNPKRVYGDIPIPLNLASSTSELTSLVNQYLRSYRSDHLAAKKNLLLRIDAEILKLYDLPPRLERQVLDLFWNQQRHVPFEFKGYIPPEKTSWIPLHVFISPEYERSTASSILERMPAIHDKELIDYLKTIGTE